MDDVAVAACSRRSSPWTSPVTGPERSGRPAITALPVTLVPFWLSDKLMGTKVPAVPAWPDHWPATLAVGALAARCGSSRAAAPPTAATQNSASNTFVVALIMAPSPGSFSVGARPKTIGPLTYLGTAGEPCGSGVARHALSAVLRAEPPAE